MILRIVMMEFREGTRDTFLSTFARYKEAIRQQPGCMALTLLSDSNFPNRFITHSYWDGTASLEAYRQSTTFNEVWPLTKALFATAPQAWSFVVEDGALSAPEI